MKDTVTARKGRLASAEPGRAKIALCVYAISGMLLALTGCTLEEAKDTPTTAPVMPKAAPPAAEGAPAAGAPNAAPPVGRAGSGAPAGAPPMAGGPMMGGMDPMAPLTPTPDMDKEIAEANKSGDKKRIGAAYAKRGHFRMTDAKAGARVKYRAALSDYRKALAADPANSQAKSEREEIESIYTSMGRPIPTEDVP